MDYGNLQLLDKRLNKNARIKNLLIELGFKHFDGYWYNIDNNTYRIRLYRTRQFLYIDLTKEDYFDMNDVIKMSNRDIDYEFIISQINNYFNG